MPSLQNALRLQKKRGTYEMIPFGKNKWWPPRDPPRKVKCETLVAFFFFLHAYSTSNLRTLRRTCVHVRKECSLEISVQYASENRIYASENCGKILRGENRRKMSCVWRATRNFGVGHQNSSRAHLCPAVDLQTAPVSMPTGPFARFWSDHW